MDQNQYQYQNYQQPQYQQPQYYQSAATDEVISTKEWLLTLLVMYVPVVNLVMMFIWAFGNNTKETKKNWSRVMLIMMAIALGLTIILSLILGGLFVGLLNAVS